MTQNTNKLIFDIGTNKGEDALFYASQGYQVIAVDADPSLIKENKWLHVDYLDKITFLNFAISDKDNDVIELFINKDPGKTSLIKDIGSRQDSFKQNVMVPTITLRSLMEKYGIPFYCKIDIEGYDVIAVKSLLGLPKMPQYLSMEAECLPEDDRFSEEGIFETLEVMREAGYTKFKLIDQASLRVLDDKDLYYKKSTTFTHRALRKLQKTIGVGTDPYNFKMALEKQYKFPFGYSASGPFGEATTGKWMSFEEAQKTYLFQRRQYFSIERNRQYSYWADWHATY